MLNGAVSGRLKSDLGYFGTNMLPEFVGITQVKTLDTYFVPGSRDSRRLIFIGDVHGCRDECMYALYLHRHKHRAIGDTYLSNIAMLTA